MPVDKELIKRKLQVMDKYLSSIEKMEFTEESFVEDHDIHDLVTFRIQQAVESAIDIAAHIVANLDIPKKETAKDMFLQLGKQKIIEKDLSYRMGQAADFRNRVVHGYNDFDFKLLFKDYKEDINDLRKYGKNIIEYIEKKKSNK